MRRLGLLAPLCVAGFVWSSLLLMGQDKKTDKEPILVTKRLPTNYKSLGLTKKQQNEIYKIQAKYAAQRQELQRKLDELKEQEKDDYENVLTAAQKERLKEILLRSDRRKNKVAKEPEANVKKKDTVAKDKKKDKATKEIPAPVEIKK